MQYAKHAWTRTFERLGGWPLVYSLIPIPIVGIALHVLIVGHGVIKNDIETWLLSAIAATAIVFAVAFIFNLGCAPFRIERLRADSATQRADTAEEELRKALAAVNANPTLPSSIARALGEAHDHSDALSDRLTLLARVIQQFEHLLNACFVQAKIRGIDFESEDIGTVTKFLAEEAHRILPGLPSEPIGPLVFQTGWNQYRYILSAPMRVAPRISFNFLPKGVSTEILRVSTIDFEVKFFDGETLNQKAIPPLPFEASAEL